MNPLQPFRRRPWWASWLALALGCFAATLCISKTSAVREISYRINDSFFRLRNYNTGPSSVIVVVIDDAALTQRGRWPWHRSQLARLVDAISIGGPRAIGLDVLLSEPSDASDDGLLAAAISRAGNVVLPAKISTSPAGPLWIEPLPLFARAASGVGHVQAILDEDGVCRRLPNTEMSLRGTIPMMARALADTSHGERRGSAQETKIQFLQPIQHTIDYRGLDASNLQSIKPFQTISAADILSGKKYDFSQQTVLIGFAGSGLEDELLTPLNYGSPAPGVLIQANMVDTLDRSRSIESVNLIVQLTILFGICLAGSKIIQAHKVARTAAWVMGVLLGTYLLAYVSFVVWGSQFHLGPAFVAELLVVPLGQLQHILVLQGLISRSLVHLQRQAQDIPLHIAGFLEPQVPLETSAINLTNAEWKLSVIARTDEQITIVSAFQQTLLQAMRDGIAVFDEDGFLLFENATWQGFLTLCRWRGDSCWSELRRALHPEMSRVMEAQRGPGTHESSGSKRMDKEVLIAGRLWRISLARLPAMVPTDKALYMVLTADLTPQMERDQARQQALQFITHELRTPLVSLQGFAELLQYFPEQAKAAGAVATIHRESERLVALTSMFLECLRLETTLPVIAPALTDAETLMNRACSLAQPLCAASDKNLAVTIPQDKVGLYLDLAMMTGALLNLIANAVKYGTEETEIKARVEHLDDQVVFSVCNQGARIPEDELSRLFIPQYRMSENATGRTGWGIGLAFVKRVMDAHGGEVLVKSNEAETCFQLVLPVHLSMEARGL
jgi:CHASE2 domain-containing sensor protein/nitrogen-specific signal transduction histidine kinase